MSKTTRSNSVFSGFGFAIFLFVLACTLPYDFEVQDTGKAIVIDATLTNERKAHLVSIFYSLALDDTSGIPVTRATVQLGTQGEWATLSEVLPGQYVTDSTYAGIPGQFYQLNIELPDGTRYLSTEEELLPSVPIDSIYARYIQVPHAFNATDPDGVQIFLDSHSEIEGHHNFRYEFRESYAVVVPFPSKYDYHYPGGLFTIFEREQPLDTCYRKRQQSRTIINSTKGLSENKISELPIQFINESLPDLAYNYRIGVKQYSISDAAFNFYRQLRDINESSGSLFDRQLGTVEGNVFSEGQNALPVLGYFDVAGVSEVRRTFNYLPFVEEGIRTEPNICLPTDSITTSPCTTDIQIGIQVLFEREVIRVVDGDSVRFNEPYYDFRGVRDAIEAGEDCINIVDIESPGTLAFIAGAYCSDCRYHGLYERPEVWDDP